MTPRLLLFSRSDIVSDEKLTAWDLLTDNSSNVTFIFSPKESRLEIESKANGNGHKSRSAFPFGISDDAANKLIDGFNELQQSIRARQKEKIYIPKFDPINGGESYVAARTSHGAYLPRKDLKPTEVVPGMSALASEFRVQAHDIEFLHVHGEFLIGICNRAVTRLAVNYAFPEIANYLQRLGPKDLPLEEYDSIVNKVLYQQIGPRLKSPSAALRG